MTDDALRKYERGDRQPSLLQIIYLADVFGVSLEELIGPPHGLRMMTQPHSHPARHPIFFKEWRKFRGYTQKQLAEIIGVTASSISHLETGKQGFTDKILYALAEAFACSPGDLLTRKPFDEDAVFGSLPK